MGILTLIATKDACGFIAGPSIHRAVSLSPFARERDFRGYEADIVVRLLSDTRRLSNEEEAGTHISRDGTQSESAESIFAGGAENFGSPISSHGEQPLSVDSLTETKASPAQIPLPPSPAVSLSEVGSGSTHDSVAAEAPSFAPPFSRQQGDDGLREGLRRLAELRMGALEVRAMKQEERTNTRNLRWQFTEEVRKLTSRMKKKFPYVTQDDLTRWEDSLILIEDTAEEIEQADIKIAQAEGHVIQVEWDMCGLEQELYGVTAGEGPSLEKPSGIMRGSSHPWSTSAGSVVDAVAPSSPVSSGDANPLASQPGIAAEARYYCHTTPSSERSLGSEEIRESFRLLLPAEEEAFLAEQNLLQESATRESAELNLCNGWQFVDVDTAAIREEASKTGPLASGPNDPDFTETDLYGLSRWLMYGTPWNIHLMSNQDRLRTVIASLQVFRAWLTGNYNALLAPHVPSEPNAHSAPHFWSAEHDERNYSMLTRYVRNWQWDPYAKANAGLEDITEQDYDTLRGDLETGDQASATQRALSAPFFEPLVLNTANINAFARHDQRDTPPEAASLNRRTLAVHAPSEAFPHRSTRHDFPAYRERCTRTQSLP